MSKIDDLKRLYSQASKLDEEYPKQIIDKLSIYGQILEILGNLWAAATLDWKMAEAKRRETIANVYSLDPQGSNKDKEMKAEMAAAKWRQEEAKYEAETQRFKNAYTSVLEQIQILKKRYEHLVNVSKGGV
ncbi:hypothetical protein [Caldifermentibacillus hisashii]|uniref:hypothetical protein n=1 Tax=Caldifermentibacillus hisashii TaxID=996558 RepID=UPI001C0FD6FC|nr:hypothetical protein [Caldifermentibacillus hisashii]MBU5342299.1 hypothetical protein [Caldifermentibacillus hisashii]